jgi:hypothetical protein
MEGGTESMLMVTWARRLVTALMAFSATAW